MPRTMIEPFRIKSVEPIRMTTAQERLGMLEAAKLNVFKLRAEDVLLDWLTDSGTGAMSSAQWGAIMIGDESYAGARSFFRLEAVLQDITGMPHFIPTHQGRAAEKVLFSAVCKQGDLVPNNCHFDTTRANLEFNGVEAVDLVIPEGLQPSLIHPFKGNIDLARVEVVLKQEGHRIPFGMLTVTNNTGGGQPVSMANIRAYAKLLKQYGKPFIMDVCRFAENAMFIKLREEGYQDTPIRAICQEMFSYADGCTMSAKKDGLVNIGGFIMLRSDEWLDPVRNMLILTEGFPTYGGMAGRDLEALAVGLEEGMQEDYLRYRLRTAEYMGEKLLAGGVWAAGAGAIQGSILAVWILLVAAVVIGIGLKPLIDFVATHVIPIQFDQNELGFGTAVGAAIAWVPAFVAGRRAVRACATISGRTRNELAPWWALAGMLGLGWLVVFVFTDQQSWLVVAFELAR